MTITAIEPQKRERERRNIFIDGEYAFSLYIETVYQFGLTAGKQVTEQQIQQMRRASDQKLCFSAALRYISRRRCTQKTISDYLLKKGYFAESIDNAVQKLKEYRYIDDDAYAKDYARVNAPNKGVRRIRRELAQKGIEDAPIETDSQTELANCLALADKFLKNRSKDLKEKQRLYRHLLYRGFDIETVYRTVCQKFGDELQDL